MATREVNLFIVDGDRLVVRALRQFLYNKFGNQLNISTFYSSEKCIEKIVQNTHFVILAYYLDEIKEIEILKTIKLINPNTEVIIHSSNEEVGKAIDSFVSHGNLSDKKSKKLEENSSTPKENFNLSIAVDVNRMQV